jgi:uncharacterized membrane protein
MWRGAKISTMIRPWPGGAAEPPLISRVAPIMHRSLPLLFRAIAYELRGGFLIRPFLIALALGVAGAMLSSVEARIPGIGAWVPETLFPSRNDPQTAQLILGSIATSIMTVVSIVFAMLLMTLTLASTQFSPRILVSFVRDKATQWTLGVLLGTFSYCIAVLPAVHSPPYAFVPVVSVSVAMGLAVVSVAWLIFFIHHISQAISVNHIVDRIARDTEQVIAALMPHARGEFEPATHPRMSDGDGPAILSPRSGYIRFIDIAGLMELAKACRVRIRVERGVGQFVPAGVPLARVSRQSRVSPLNIDQLLSAFDIGPTRTLQQDVEFGVIQIVDIALRALSPAVNDPSTAISCIDQLSSILIVWCGRTPPPACLFDPPHVARVEIPWIGLEGMLNTAFEQIRHYAVADLAVSLRLLRAMGDIASATPRGDVHAALRARAHWLVERAAETLLESDAARLRHRLAELEGVLRG